MVRQARSVKGAGAAETKLEPFSGEGVGKKRKKTKKKANSFPKLLKEGLGDEGDEVDTGTLTLNEAYAKRYNEKKDQELLAKSKRILEEEASDGSSESDEDEVAELLTPKVEHKIFETLQKIKSKDPSIYDKSHVFFDENDFEEAEAVSSSGVASPAAKGMKYKDFLRETLMKDGADAIAKEEDALEKKSTRKTPLEEQRELKAAIVAAAHGSGADGEDDDDDFFKPRQKSIEEAALEEAHYESFLKKPAGRNRDKADSEEIISRYWKADEDLDESEQFLRDYLLNKSWMETDSIQSGSKDRGYHLRGQLDPVSDDSDEEHLEKVDQFEKDYNFRFETEEGGQIQGHSRVQLASVREKPDKRKRQRKEKEERKEAEKIRRVEELKRLKNLKKQEIARRLKQLQEVTGNEETALGAVDLDADFDPDAHDSQMLSLLGEEYDQQHDDLDEEDLAKVPAGLESELLLGSTVSTSSAYRSAKRSKTSAGDDHEEENEGEEDENVDDETWWLCDGCGKGIVQGKRRFDCSVCENYTLCIKCFRCRKHPHKFVRRRVPQGCMPPEELKDRAADRAEMLDSLDEYFQMDYEDIIGGDLPTRFKYRSVEGNSFGMTPQDILSKTDQELNRLMPLKKLRTYRGGTAASDVQDTNDSRLNCGGRGGGRRGGRGASRGEGRGGGAGWDGGMRHRGRGQGGGAQRGPTSGVGAQLGSQRLSAYNLDNSKSGRPQKKPDRQDD